MKPTVRISGVCGVAAVIALFSVLATAVASGAGAGSSGQGASADVDAVSVVPALGHPLEAADAGALAQFQQQQEDAELVPDPTLPSNGADLADARPADILGSRQRVWIAPAGERICTYVSMADGGYGVGCPTLDEVRDGQAVSIVAKAAGEANATVTVVAIVPAGGVPPALIDTQGTRTALPTDTDSNVAAAVVPASDSLDSGLGTIDLGEFTSSPRLAVAG